MAVEDGKQRFGKARQGLSSKGSYGACMGVGSCGSGHSGHRLVVVLRGQVWRGRAWWVVGSHGGSSRCAASRCIGMVLKAVKVRRGNARQ